MKLCAHDWIFCTTKSTKKVMCSEFHFILWLFFFVVALALYHYCNCFNDTFHRLGISQAKMAQKRSSKAHSIRMSRAIAKMLCVRYKIVWTCAFTHYFFFCLILCTTCCCHRRRRCRLLLQQFCSQLHKNNFYQYMNDTFFILSFIWNMCVYTYDAMILV